MAENFSNLKSYLDAIKYYNLSIGLYKAEKNQLDLGRGYSNIGSAYSSLGAFDKALLYYDSGYSIAIQLNNPFSIAQNLTNKGTVYERQGKYKEAKIAYEKCLEISTKTGIGYGKLLSYINLGSTSRRLKNYQQSELYLNEALELAKEMKLIKIESEVYHQQANLYEDWGDYKKANKLLHRFYTMDDSLHTAKVQNESIALKEQYESEKKSNEINILKAEKLRSQRLILFLMLLAFILIALMQWNRFKRKQAKLMLFAEEAERKFLKKMVETREKELTVQLTQIAQLEEEIKAMHEELLKIIDNSSDGAESLKRQLKSQLVDKNEFIKINEGFEERITDFNQEYFKLLLSKYPELTLSELKLCAYLRLGLSTKEIAQLLNRSVRTIESSRTDIRKKMKLTIDENLINHLIMLKD